MSRRSVGINTGNEQCCPLDDPEARLSYRNTEGYADPTCFYALRNVMHQEKKQHRSRDQPNKKNYKTLVIRYD